MARTYWMPGPPGSPHLTPRQRLTLAVESPQRPTDRVAHWKLWKRRVQVLVLIDPATALQMVRIASTHEKTADLERIVRGGPNGEIWRGLVGAESTQHLMRMIDWNHPGTQIEPPTQSLLEILDVLRLQEAPSPLLPELQMP